MAGGLPPRGWIGEREKARFAEEISRLTARELADFEAATNREVGNFPSYVARAAAQATTQAVRATVSLAEAVGSALSRWFGSAPKLMAPEEAAQLPPTVGAFTPRAGLPPIVERIARSDEDAAPDLGGIQQIPQRAGALVDTGSLNETDDETFHTIGSSNVFAFRYDEPTLTFYVQFLGGDSDNRTGPGPTYAYYGVTPERANKVFEDGSAGGAVWSYFRIRGTQSGHQVDYSLVGTGPSNYVPRKATESGLVRRTMKQNGRVLRSPKRGSGRFGSSE